MTYVVELNVNLQTFRTVAHVGETCLAHLALEHDAPGQTNHRLIVRYSIEILKQFGDHMGPLVAIRV